MPPSHWDVRMGTLLVPVAHLVSLWAAGWWLDHFSLLQDRLLMMSQDLLKKNVNYSAPHQGN